MTIWYAPSPHSVVDLSNFTADQVDFREIARSLSGIRRFNGSVPFSVAAHSLAVASLVSDKARPWALLHDAHEAYPGDSPGPVKEWMKANWDLGPRFDALFHKLDYAIAEAAGVVESWADPEVQAEVKRADKICLYAEIGMWFDKRVMSAMGPRDFMGIDLIPFINIKDPYIDWLDAVRRVSDGVA